jgi:hypothetical protein
MQHVSAAMLGFSPVHRSHSGKRNRQDEPDKTGRLFRVEISGLVQM